MFEWLKRRDWQPEVVPEARGLHRQLEVVIRNLPCLRDARSGERKFAYAGFGHEILEEVHKQLGGAERTRAMLASGAPRQALLRLRGHAPLSVELRGVADADPRRFESDVADTLIAAFESIGLRP